MLGAGEKDQATSGDCSGTGSEEAYGSLQAGEVEKEAKTEDL
jgi:hypothetical protein